MQHVFGCIPLQVAFKTLGGGGASPVSVFDNEFSCIIVERCWKQMTWKMIKPKWNVHKFEKYNYTWDMIEFVKNDVRGTRCVWHGRPKLLVWQSVSAGGVRNVWSSQRRLDSRKPKGKSICEVRAHLFETSSCENIDVQFTNQRMALL